MKKLVFPLFAGASLFCAHPAVNAQEFHEHISKAFTPSKESSATVFAVYNVDGPVSVEGYSGSKVLIEVDKLISADNTEDLETGKKEFRLEFEQTPDTILAYISEPLDSRGRTRNNHQEGRDIHYRYNLRFTVKVPFEMNLAISTVNNGDITVTDVAGALKINNVNGSLHISNAKGVTQARTVNGNVEVSYVANPKSASIYHTVNGEIRVSYPADVSADLAFKTVNGEFFSDFPNIEILPGKVTKTQEKGGTVTLYKLNKISSARIGGGGVPFSFETINGNIYVKKQS